MGTDTVYPAKMETIERLLRGSIDMHIHAGPHPMPRPDALHVALQAQEAGMRAIVLKSRSYPSAPVGYIVSLIAHDIAVFGGLILDAQVCGLNAAAVEESVAVGAKIIWMPVLSSANHHRRHGLSGEGITILDDSGELLPPVQEILEIVRDSHIIVATGHLSKSEAFTLVSKARRIGISKILVTHATDPVVGLTVEEQMEFVKEGAVIEHSLFSCLPHWALTTAGHGHAPTEPQRILAAVKAVGADHCVLSTDLGTSWGPNPPEGMRMFIAMMLAQGLSEEEVSLMVKEVPARLLDLD